MKKMDLSGGEINQRRHPNEPKKYKYHGITETGESETVVAKLFSQQQPNHQGGNYKITKQTPKCPDGKPA